ncbi:Required for respiratory growth protein 9, mitochondrial [Erysiphe neolycopersici]|uniref:Required for respiratory growth protein 9, mitochondrial n=1 Tax=Erysiphe neolycopersici TaxID=212602 RepID=A0A420H795_9PEZI|nr:Required for respiratory growth protein 9, mitochondrial [Erysiphe neolycopersici]
MANRCTALTLRSFMVTIAKFDIFTYRSSKKLTNLDHSYLISNLRLRSISSVHRQLCGPYKDAKRKISKENLHSEYTNAEEITRDIHNGTKGDFDDAVVEISPDTIDQLATEAFIKNRTHYQSSDNILEQSFQKITDRPSLEANEEKTLLKGPIEDGSRQKAPPLYEIRKKFRMKNDNLSTRKEFLDDNSQPRPKEPWMIEKERVKEKYPNGYRPLKRLSPDAIEGIRALNSQMPEQFTTARLSKEFKISPEAIRRILKSKWRPNIDEAHGREVRWARRGEQIWSRWAEQGATPPKKIRRLGIGEKPPPSYYEPDPLPKLITTSTRRTSEDTHASRSSSGKDGIL